MISRLLAWWRVDHEAEARTAAAEAQRWRTEYMKMRGRLGALSRERGRQERHIDELWERARSRQNELEHVKQSLIRAENASLEDVMHHQREVARLQKEVAAAKEFSKEQQLEVIDRMFARNGCSVDLPAVSEWMGVKQ